MDDALTVVSKSGFVAVREAITVDAFSGGDNKVTHAGEGWLLKLEHGFTRRVSLNASQHTTPLALEHIQIATPTVLVNFVRISI